MFPRQPGASHLHDFFGNQTTNAHSTLSTMTAGRTVCTYWVCFDGGDPRREPPASCTPTDSIFLVIEFPECWNGALDSADHRSHLAYPTGDVCPGTHPTAIPRLVAAFLYPVGTPTGAITLASGNVYSAHGDFWNTWNQVRLEQLTASCVNAGVDCGFQEDNTTSVSRRRLDEGRIRRLIGGGRRGY